MRRALLILGLLASTCWAETPAPVIDMHLHAYVADRMGPPPLAMCTPLGEIPVWDPAKPYGETFMRMFKQPSCDDPVWSPESDQELIDRTVAQLEKHNVYGPIGGRTEMVGKFVAAAPERLLYGQELQLGPDAPKPELLVEMHQSGRLDVVGEIVTQYQGIAPADERLEPYWAALEAADIPAGIHVGPGPPGVVYLGSGNYRAHMHSALTIEEVLVRHPKLRVYLMHAGYPLLDDLLATLYAHPQLYVGVGVIVYTQPREDFYRYLKAIVDAGFGRRVMFGSDQMVWPETIGRSIRVIEEAPFLTDEQKRDILFNNAARFLRLSDEKIAEMRVEAGGTYAVASVAEGGTLTPTMSSQSMSATSPKRTGVAIMETSSSCCGNTTPVTARTT